MYVPDPDKLHEKRGKIKHLEWYGIQLELDREDRFHKIQMEWYRFQILFTVFQLEFHTKLTNFSGWILAFGSTDTSALMPFFHRGCVDFKWYGPILLILNAVKTDFDSDTNGFQRYWYSKCPL